MLWLLRCYCYTIVLHAGVYKSHFASLYASPFICSVAVKYRWTFRQFIKIKALLNRLIASMKWLSRQNDLMAWLIFAVYPFNFLLIIQYWLINSQLQVFHHLCHIEILACKTNFAILSNYVRNDRYPPPVKEKTATPKSMSSTRQLGVLELFSFT